MQQSVVGALRRFVPSLPVAVVALLQLGLKVGRFGSGMRRHVILCHIGAAVVFILCNSHSVWCFIVTMERSLKSSGLLGLDG